MPPEPRSKASLMRVAACVGDGEVRLERRPTPKPGTGELVLRLRGCGLCGTDLFKLRHGVPPGTVLGHELVGEVESLGEGVETFRFGQRIVVPHHVACGVCRLCRGGSETLCPTFREDLLEPGGFGERILVRSRAVAEAAHALPDSLSDETAIFLEPAACVLRGIRRSGLSAEPVRGGADLQAAILGAGSMGLLHLLVLRALWPEMTVVVVDPVDGRRSLVAELGGLAVPPDEAPATVGRRGGADAVFDTAGGSALLGGAFRLAREGGAVVLFAHARPGDRAAFDLNPFFKSEHRLVATYSGSLVEQRAIFELLVSGRLDPSALITHRLPLSQFGDAVRLTESREALKVMMVPDDA